jgi:hypothetical protein
MDLCRSSKPSAPHNQNLNFSRDPGARGVLDAKKFQAVVLHPISSGLRRIDLSYNLVGLTDEVLACIACSSAAQSLSELDISHTYCIKKPLFEFPKLEKLKYGHRSKCVVNLNTLLTLHWS